MTHQDKVARFGIALLLALAPGAAAQEPASDQNGNPAQATVPAPAKAAQKKKPAQPSPAAQPDQQAVMPDAEKIVLLLRATLLTLNDAVQTGNYTVLRDVAAPGFRDANNAARLAQIFANLAAQNLDLSTVSVIAPQLAEPPRIDPQNGMLHLKGYFPGQPVQIDFDILFQPVGGRWRLFGLSVQPTRASLSPAAPSATSQPSPQPQSAQDAAVTGPTSSESATEKK
jgi:hypothetical protein